MYSIDLDFDFSERYKDTVCAHESSAIKVGREMRDYKKKKIGVNENFPLHTLERMQKP